MIPVSDKPSRLVARHRSLLGVLFGMSLQQQAFFFRQLASMIDSGMTGGKALDVLGNQTPGRFGRVLKELASYVGDGDPLSSALALYPEYFSEFVVCMIRAGELGGMLDDRLRDLAAYLEQAYAMQSALISMMAYPVIVLHAAILLPPLHVLVMQGWMPYLFTVLPLLVVLYGGVTAWWLFSRFTSMLRPLRHGVDQVLLLVPGIGGLLWRGAGLKFARALGELIEAGLPMGTSVEVASRACGNVALASRLVAVVPQLREGMPLSAVLPATGIFSPAAMQMVVSSEASGTTGQALRKISDFVSIEYNESVKRMGVVLPMLLLFAVAGVVGYQYIKTFMNLMSNLQGINP